MIGHLHIQPISKTWVVSYNKNSFTTSYIPVYNYEWLYESDDNKEVYFILIEVDNKEVAHINYENL